jgi:hypothetical protein
MRYAIRLVCDHAIDKLIKDNGTKLTPKKLQVINRQSKTIQKNNSLSENVAHTFND